MVDEDVETTAVTEHLEVTSVLVDVKNDVQILIGNELFQLHHGAHVGHWHRRFIQHLECAQGVTAQNDHRPCLGQFFKWFVPLAHLIQVYFTIGEIHANFKVVLGKWMFSQLAG